MVLVKTEIARRMFTLLQLHGIVCHASP